MSQASHSLPKDWGLMEGGRKTWLLWDPVRFNTSPGRSEACPTPISNRGYWENSIFSCNLGNSTWKGNFMDVRSHISCCNTLGMDFSYLGFRQSWQSQLGHLPKMVLPIVQQESTTSNAATAGEHQEMHLGKTHTSSSTPRSPSPCPGTSAPGVRLIKKSHNKFLPLVRCNEHTKLCRSALN